MSKQVTHLPLSDMLYSYCFDEAMAAIDEKDFNNLSLADIFELYPIVNYENDLSSLNEEAKEMFLSKKPKTDILSKKLSKYFRSLNDKSFVEDIKSLFDIDSLLVHNYFDAFEKYFKKPTISDESFLLVLENDYIPLYFVLEKQKISKAFEKPIKEFMVTSPSTITLFVSEYDEEHRLGHKQYHIPIKLFSDKEVEKMIDAYINNDYANLNIVNCLMHHKNGEGNYNISPSMKIKIKQAHKRLQDKLYNNGTTFSEDYEIRIDPNQEEPGTFRQEGKVKVLTYGGKWISDNIDSKPTLLNNLIYIFGFVDGNFRFSFLPASNSGNGLLDAFDNRHKYEYGDFTFHSIDSLSNTIFYAYYNYLWHKEIKLEEIYEWFVNKYIKTEFNIDGFETFLVIEGDNFNFKCKNIFSEIDKLLKSYMLLQKYGTIESEMFLAESLCKYHDLKSLNGRKYLYLSNNKIVNKICFLLFSDQSMINYVEKGKSDTNFSKLIKHSELNINEYREYSQKDLFFLKDNGIINISNSGDITIKDYSVAKTLEELYFRGFLDINHLGSLYDGALKVLENKGWVEFGDSLFSKQEADYLSYYLNNKTFTNSLGLRNLYEHTGRLNAKDNELFSDYLKGLKILGMIIIKINDELCLRYPENNNH